MSEGSKYTFKLCSSANDLRDAYRLRLEVFHKEQGFPEDTEIDQYDPISAHFILTSNEDDGKVVATVRLTPYPRTHSSATESTSTSEEKSMKQNETAMAQSGGGPGGTSGGLAMTASATSNPSPSTNQPPVKSDMEYHTGLPNPSSPPPKVNITDEDIEEKMRSQDNGYPLGGPQSESSLAHEFLRKLKSTEPFKEVEGAPKARGAKLSRLAVSKSMRGKKLGALTVREVEAWLLRILAQGGGSSQGSTGQGGEKVAEGETNGSIQSLTIIISSQMPAVGFYENLSYAVYGEPYDEEGAPHTWCTKRLVYEVDHAQS